MRKFLKNKYIIFIIIVFLSIIYFGINKIIKHYNYTDNNEIVSKEETYHSNDESDLLLDKNLEETEKQQDEEKVNDNESVEVEEENKNALNLKNRIYVYITGEVVVPGVVILSENSRIIDAINKAGGTTNKANISKVNLAYVLKDGMKINIPSDSDLKENPNFEYITTSSGDGKNDNIYGSASDNGNYEEKKSDSSMTKPGSNGFNNIKTVNINTATQTELETLPGIGPSTALKIINYRNENGRFKSIDDIKNVSGIGDSKFETLKKYITV